MNQLKLTASEEDDIRNRGTKLRELMRHDGWPVFAGLFKNAVERLDSVQEITRRDGWFPLTRDNIALRAVASKVAMDGMNEWMETVLQEVDRAVKLEERQQKEAIAKDRSLIKKIRR